jgi:hypothetical protein
MTLASVQGVIHRLKNDSAAKEAFRRDSVQFLSVYDLDPAECHCLTTGDVAGLWRLGVHPLLLVAFSRICGIAPPDYRRVMKPLVGLRSMRSAGSRLKDSGHG